MRRIICRHVLVLVLAALLIPGIKTGSNACSDGVLTIGILKTPEEQVFAELISVLVTERTGTVVKILSFDDIGALYAAVRRQNVGIVVENTERGMMVIDLPSPEKGRAALEVLKREYRKRLNLVWLDPVSCKGGAQLCAPVLSTETIDNRPALLKLINRLSAILTEDAYARLVRSDQHDDKLRRAVHNFLKSKQLI